MTQAENTTAKIAAGLAALAELGSVLEGLPERIRRIEEDARALAIAAVVRAANTDGLNPDHYYPVGEAGRFFGKAPETMRKRKYKMLPRKYGCIRGIWILVAWEVITEQEAEAYLAAERARVLNRSE